MVELKVCALVVSRLPQRLKSGFFKKSFVTQKTCSKGFEQIARPLEFKLQLKVFVKGLFGLV